MNSDQKLQLFSLAEQLGNIGHWWVEIPTQKLYWSNQVYLIHGVTPETYTPDLQSAIGFYHPGDKRRVVEYIEHSISKGLSFEFSLRIIRPSGEIRHVKSKAHCNLNDQGKAQGIVGVFQDVTDEELAKTASEKADAVNMTLMESSNDGFWDWHIQDDYEYMSPRFWEMFGYLPEEKPHKPDAWKDMIFKEDLALALENFGRHIETKGQHPYSQEVRYQHKNGSTVTVLCQGKVIEWADDGTPLRMVGTHTDVTKFKNHEQHLKSDLNFQTLLMNENTDLVFVKDEKFRIVSANKAFLSLYPKDTQDSIIGSTTIEEYNDEEAEAFLAEDKKAFAEGVSEIEETILFPDGNQRTLLTRKIRFYDDNNKVFILAVARDISDLKRTEKELRTANEELEEFAYRTSHDLRSPLVSSRRLLNFTKQDVEKDRKNKAIQNIDMVSESLGELENLVTEILQLTKLRHEKTSPVLINVPKLIDSVIKKICHMENFDRIIFHIDLEKNHNELLLPKTYFEQAVENLISNAVKYQDIKKPESTIKISTKVDKNTFIFEVSDNGLGIPKENQGQVFSMFKRFHTKTSFGSGLGLYMLKKGIEKMNGNIQYEPLENGSQFIVKLPFIALPTTS